MGRLKAAVLGCGPTGLLAAHGIRHAAEIAGKDVEIQIFSVKRPSPLFGCQYLHRSIPGLKLRAQRVSYELVGDAQTYRAKVYGSTEDIAVSPDLLERDHDAWDIRAAYAQLWNEYEICIVNASLDISSWPKLRDSLRVEGFSMFVSSLPATVLCQDTTRARCTFTSQNVWAMGDAPQLGRYAAVPDTVKNGHIVCSGDPRVPWYRASRVFKHGTVEWPENAAPPRGASRVQKPLGTTCKCNPDVMRVGRYGVWEKGVLAHTAFEHARDNFLHAVGA